MRVVMWIVERRFKIQLNRKFSSATAAAAAVTATATDRKKKYSIQLHIIGRDDAQQLKHVCANNFISLFFRYIAGTLQIQCTSQSANMSSLV